MDYSRTSVSEGASSCWYLGQRLSLLEGERHACNDDDDAGSLAASGDGVLGCSINAKLAAPLVVMCDESEGWSTSMR
jgi:hypothetical protein